jgi:hypothetical protein
MIAQKTLLPKIYSKMQHLAFWEVNWAPALTMTKVGRVDSTRTQNKLRYSYSKPYKLEFPFYKDGC